MRVIGEIPHPDCKITLFSWNNRYLIKLELGLLEQTYKVDQFELTGDDDLKKIVDDNFMKQAMLCFGVMEQTLRKSLDNL